MRQVLRSLLLLSAAVIPTLAHADGMDNFVLTGAGHTFRFSLPATGTAYISLNPPRLSDHYTLSNADATVDGIGGYRGGGDFRFFATQNGDASFGFANPDLGRSFSYYLYGGASLIGYTNATLTGAFSGTADVFFRLGTFDLNTYDFNATPIGVTPFTLTITPEASNTSTPEPTTLALLATGSLGVPTSLRRRLIA